MATEPAPISRPMPSKASERLNPALIVPTPRHWIAAAAVLTVLLAAAFGAGAGALLRDDPAPVATSDVRVASVGPVGLELDGDWTAVRPAPALAAAGLQDLTAFEPVAGLPGRTWVARARADAPSLVPAGIRARVSGALPAPEATKLAGEPAWLYAGLPLRAGGTLELTVQPTTAGVLVVGCEAAPAWWSTVAGCARSVLAVSGVQARPPSADIALGERLPAAVTKLNAARVKGGRALARARTARGQQHAARALAAAHAAAASRLAPFAAAQGPGPAVVAKLKAAAGAYGRLAAAAGRKAPRRYASARTQVRRTGAALRAALARAAG